MYACNAFDKFNIAFDVAKKGHCSELLQIILMTDAFPLLLLTSHRPEITNKISHTKKSRMLYVIVLQTHALSS